MRILVATPYITGAHDPPCRESVDSLDYCGMEHAYHVQLGYGVDMQRNRIAAKAVSDGFDWLLMVDGDVTLPKDALANLLEHDADVCMGWYLNRHAHGNAKRTCLYGIGRGWDYYESDALREKRDNGVYTLRVKGGGLGCCLVRTALFDVLRFPWFVWSDITWDRATGNVESCGEDIDFCIKCEQAGVPIIADTRVECGHK